MDKFKRYIMAWLTLMVFMPDTDIYDHAWQEIHSLEQEYGFSAEQLSRMRSWVSRHL